MAAAGPQPLVWEQKDGYRFAALPISQNQGPRLTLLSREQTGILFTNHLSYQRATENQNLLNGAGLAAGDYDGDGWCDLYFCNLEGEDALYRNQGNWTFQNVTAEAGLDKLNQVSRAAVFADLNGDSHLDLLVSSIGGPNACLLNDGQGHFQNITEKSGMTLKAGGHSYALADIDGDGDLDVYLANYGENSILRSGGSIAYRYVNGRPIISGRYAARLKIIDGELIELGEPDVLYLNDGQAGFSPLSWTGGAFLDEAGNRLRAKPYDMGLSVMFRDINQDGYPDLYVCNDFQTPDRIWMNDGTGRFRALPGPALAFTSQFSMGVDFADIDRDGFDDFFLSDMLSPDQRLRMTQLEAKRPPQKHVDQVTNRDQARRNTLFWNRGDGTYAEIAPFAGLQASDWSWSVVFFDADLDGYEDLLIANGHAYDTQNLDIIDKAPDEPFKSDAMRGSKDLLQYPALRTPNLLFRNRGDLTFESIGHQLGFESTQVTHGISLVDLDNDGDQDVVASCLWDPPLVYRNDCGAPRVAVRLRGLPPNGQGIGARIIVTGGPVAQSQEIISGGRYLAADDPMRVFAAGATTNVLSIEVRWRSGRRSLIAEAHPNHIYEIDERDAEPWLRTEAPPAPTPFFADVSDRLNHTHPERAFNDFDRQPSLPWKLSEAGPGIAWYDLEGDGDDDLMVGGGNTGFLAVFENDGKGGFKRLLAEAWKGLLDGEMTGVVGWSPAPGRREILAAISNYEASGTESSQLMHYDPKQTQPGRQTLNSPASAGPVAVADIDGDGALDVFVGGYVVPGRFPEPAASLLFRNRQGRLLADDQTNKTLEKLGLVQDAVFSDLNGDGYPELILSCFWGTIRVFMNDQGRFTDRTKSLGFEAFPGLWQGITTGDVNGDGRMDIVAANWGWNTYLGRPSMTHPIYLQYGDLDGNGTLDVIEGFKDLATGSNYQRRQLALLGEALPLLRVQYPTHQHYSTANLDTLISSQPSPGKRLVAFHLASTVFVNQGDHFEPHVLPDAAQFAPAFAVRVADLDGDGNEDIFLSQNFTGTRDIDAPMNAGQGLWLRGDGTGGWQSVMARESGIAIPGQQRGAALSDFDADGRVDLVVAQNGAPTKLYHNVGARPGLRVRLAGPAGNPEGVGAYLRMPSGPAREVHAGSGYWSQDSSISVMARPADLAVLTVRWPGGETKNYAIPETAKEVELSISGTVKTTR